jgi:hypothetical protein
MADGTDHGAELLPSIIAAQLSTEVADQIQAEQQKQVIVEALQIEGREEKGGITGSKICWSIFIGVLMLVVVGVVGAALIAASLGGGATDNGGSEERPITGTTLTSTPPLMQSSKAPISTFAAPMEVSTTTIGMTTDSTNMEYFVLEILSMKYPWLREC